MKKFITVVALVGFSFVSTAALANQDTGCGLGTMLWKGKDGKPANIMAATTNGISGNQTFGMSSGTLGCKADGVVMADQQTKVFLAVNFENISEEMSQGQGEYLSTYAQMLGYKNVEDFSRVAQANYDKIFTENATADQVLKRTLSIVKA